MAPPLSDAEWKVMNAVWAREAPASAREIHADVSAETGWAYTTVKTVMDRLAEKGALSASMTRNVSWYRAKLPRGRAVAAATRDLARRAFGGAVGSLVHHVVSHERLSDRDIAELRRMLDDAERSKRDEGSR